MSNYTIKEVHGSQDGSFIGKDGTNVSLTDYQLTVTNPQGQDGKVILSQKPETAAPTVGQTIDGETKPIPGGPLKGQLKLKKTPPAQFQGGGFSGPQNGSQPPQNDDRQRSIEMQVSAKCAAQVVAAMVATGQGGEAQISGLTDAFYKAIQGGPAPSVATAQSPVATNDAPADTSDFGPPASAAVADDDIPFGPSRI